MKMYFNIEDILALKMKCRNWTRCEDILQENTVVAVDFILLESEYVCVNIFDIVHHPCFHYTDLPLIRADAYYMSHFNTMIKTSKYATTKRVPFVDVYEIDLPQNKGCIQTLLWKNMNIFPSILVGFTFDETTTNFEIKLESNEFPWFMNIIGHIGYWSCLKPYPKQEWKVEKRNVNDICVPCLFNKYAILPDVMQMKYKYEGSAPRLLCAKVDVNTQEKLYSGYYRFNGFDIMTCKDSFFNIDDSIEFLKGKDEHREKMKHIQKEIVEYYWHPQRLKRYIDKYGIRYLDGI